MRVLALLVLLGLAVSITHKTNMFQKETSTNMQASTLVAGGKDINSLTFRQNKVLASMAHPQKQP